MEARTLSEKSVTMCQIYITEDSISHSPLCENLTSNEQFGLLGELATEAVMYACSHRWLERIRKKEQRRKTHGSIKEWRNKEEIRYRKK
jgi:hypothetical protein